MSNCVNCGAVLDPNNKFCIYCGTAINLQQDAAEANTAATDTVENNAETMNQTDYESATQQEEPEWKDTAKTVGSVIGTVVGAALGASLLGRNTHRSTLARRTPVKPVPNTPVHRPATHNNMTGMPRQTMHGPSNMNRAGMGGGAHTMGNFGGSVPRSKGTMGNNGPRPNGGFGGASHSMGGHSGKGGPGGMGRR